MTTHTLTGPAEITLWGNGCEVSHRTHILCTPGGDGVRLDIDIAGPEISFTGDYTVSARVLRDLLSRVDEIRKERPSGQHASSTDIGNVTVKATIQTGRIDYREIDDVVKLKALGDLVLAILHAQNVPVIPALHPLP